MNWQDLGGALVKAGAPIIGNALGGPLGGMITPFITPDPPWLSDVPVVFAIMMLLIIIGLLHRIQSEGR